MNVQGFNEYEYINNKKSVIVFYYYYLQNVDT